MFCRPQWTSYEDRSIPAVAESLKLMKRRTPQPSAKLLPYDNTPFPHSYVSLERFLNAKVMMEILRQFGIAPGLALRRVHTPASTNRQN